MNLNDITKLQKQYGIYKLQELINSGDVWHFEGSFGRAAMDALRDGSCMLPEERKRDYWGNEIPSRHDVKEGTAGSFENCRNYWMNVMIQFSMN